MMTSTQHKLWKSVPQRSSKVRGRARKTDAAFREVWDIKQRLEADDNPELRSEFHSKLVTLHELVSPKKSRGSLRVERGKPGFRTEDVVCWSSSTKDFDDLRHNDYFSASLDELASRRGILKKKKERNYCVVNRSNNPSDFYVVRVDDGGTRQREKQIERYGLGNHLNESDTDEERFENVRNSHYQGQSNDNISRLSSRDSSTGGRNHHDQKFYNKTHSENNDEKNGKYEERETLDFENPYYETFPNGSRTEGRADKEFLQRNRVDKSDRSAGRQEDETSDDVLQLLAKRLETRSREKRLRHQVEDIKRTLQERVLNSSSLSADSYSSHVSVDRAVETLDILSDALKKTDGLDSEEELQSHNISDELWFGKDDGLSRGVESEHLRKGHERNLKQASTRGLRKGESRNTLKTEDLLGHGSSSNSITGPRRGENERNSPAMFDVDEVVTLVAKTKRLLKSDNGFSDSLREREGYESKNGHESMNRKFSKLDIDEEVMSLMAKSECLLSDDGIRDEGRESAEEWRGSNGPRSVQKESVQELRDMLSRLTHRKLSGSVQSSASSGSKVQSNVPLFEEISDSSSGRRNSDAKSYHLRKDICPSLQGSTHLDNDARLNVEGHSYGSQRVREKNKDSRHQQVKDKYGDKLESSLRSKENCCACSRPFSNELIKSKKSSCEACAYTNGLHLVKRSVEGRGQRSRDSSLESDDGPLTMSELESSTEDRRFDQKVAEKNKRNQIDISSRRRESIPKKHNKYGSSDERHKPEHQRSRYNNTNQVNSIKRNEDLRKSENSKNSQSKTISRERLHGNNSRRKKEEDTVVGNGKLLTLEDVQQLHREVKVRLDGGETEKNAKRGEKKMNGSGNKMSSNKGQSNFKRPASPSKQKGVLIPGRSKASGGTSVSERHKNRYASSKAGPQETSNPAIGSGLGSSQDGDSIHMSADITIPDLFGMKITKTIQRQDGSIQLGHDLPERCRLNLSLEESVDGNIENIQYELTGFDSVGLQNGRRGYNSPRISDTNESAYINERYMDNDKPFNKMVDNLEEADVDNEDDFPCMESDDFQNPDDKDKSRGDSLRSKFFSSCIEKLQKEVESMEEDVKTQSGRNGYGLGLGPASVFEPPERDTSTPNKKSEPFHGNPLLAGTKMAFSHSAADTIMSQLHNPDTLRLLQNLYRADDSQRTHLIQLTHYFKTWQTNARRQKQHRKTHEIYMHRAGEFETSHLRTRYFYTWFDLAQDHHKERVAAALFQRHMLKKGLDAFRWAISRSLHRQDMMRGRVANIQLSAAFYKWRKGAETRRERRLVTAFDTWRSFTLEAQRARTLRKSLDRKLLQSMLGRWRERHQVRVKQHKADYYRRRTMLSHMWLSWSDFTALAQQKRSRNQRALAVYREHLQRRMLEEMVQAHQKHLRAKVHFRRRTLERVLMTWRATTVVYRTERQQDMTRSRQHWYSVTLTQHFLYWRESLWQRRACRMDQQTVCRHTFCLWRDKWQRNTARRQQIERQIEMNKLGRSLRVWQDNVVMQKRRQAAAVFSLENVLLRQVIGDWRRYTGVRVDMRQRMVNHIDYCNSLRVAECFRVWKTEFEKRMDVETAKKFWSNRCAKKASLTWQLLCRKRRLKKTLVESEPLRQLTLQQVMFVRWVEAKRTLDREKEEAGLMRTLLERGQLQRRFTVWREATELALRIKPLQHRHNTKLILECLRGWRNLTLHKKECKHSRYQFLKACQQRALNRWKRQYVVHQIEREIRHRMSMGLARVCLDEWNLVIRRKHAAQQFHDLCLLRDMFQHWQSRSERQIELKTRVKAEKERKENLKSYYLALWWSNIQEQITETEDSILMLKQRQAHNRIRRSFVWWRDHLRHTRSGRYYYQMLCERSMRTVLLEWHIAANSSLSDAVNDFRANLGLPALEDDGEEDREPVGGYLSEGSVASSSGFHSNKELSMWPDFDDNVDRASTSPRSSSSMRLAFTRWLNGDSESVMGTEPGVDGRSISVFSHASSNIADQRAQRRERVKMVVLMAMTRLRHWPVSVVFDQWVEFTARQRELKQLASRLAEIHRHTQLSVFLHRWRESKRDMDMANTHLTKVLTGKAMCALIEYRKRREAKQKLSALASRYNSLIVYRQFFPVWLAKTQERQHKHHILHLWSTTTPEEQELIPFETTLRKQFSRRTLRICFAIWSLKFQFAYKIKHAYHSGLLRRTLCSWLEWSRLCRERREKCDVFRRSRVQALVFKTWQKRLSHKHESQRRYTETWQSYLHLVVVSWSQWAKVHKQQRLTAAELTRRRETRVLHTRLSYWRKMTRSAQQAQHQADSSRYQAVFCAWRDFLAHRKKTRQTILSFQVACYTNLVKKLFERWREGFLMRLRQKAQREELVRLKAVELARVWRRRAQSARGRQLQVDFQHNKLRQYFTKWKNAHGLCTEREAVLERHLEGKSKQLLGRYMEAWRVRQMGDRAGRVYNRKLGLALLDAWREWCRGAKERRIRGLALQKALQERRLTVYYKYWSEMTRVKKIVQTHSHLKIQLRVLQGWREYTRTQIILRQQEAFLTCKVNRRILLDAFVTMRCRFDYCQGLADMATSLQHDREDRIKKLALRMWQSRLDRIMAAQCYGKFLVVRTVRKWRGFVQRRRDERRIQHEKMQLALRHYNRKLCSLALHGLKNELRVKHHQERRRDRLAAKYGRAWKRYTDLAHTASCLERERLYSRMWTKWRVAYSQHRAMDQVSAFERRQLVSQVFSAWRGLVFKKLSVRKSSIPVATTSRIPTYSPPTDQTSAPGPTGSRIPTYSPSSTDLSSQTTRSG